MDIFPPCILLRHFRLIRGMPPFVSGCLCRETWLTRTRKSTFPCRKNIDQYQDISSLFSPAEEDDSLQEPTTPASITYYDESKDIYEYEEMSDSETAVLSEILNQSQGYTPSQEEQSTVLNATRFACFQPSESSMLYFLPYEDDFPLCDTMNHMAYPLTEEQRNPCFPFCKITICVQIFHKCTHKKAACRVFPLKRPFYMVTQPGTGRISGNWFPVHSTKSGGREPAAGPRSAAGLPGHHRLLAAAFCKRVIPS